MPLGFASPAVPIKTEALQKGIVKPDVKPAVNMNIPFEEVEIPMPDQLIIIGRLYDPTQKGEDEERDLEKLPKDKYPLVILLHELGGSNADWGTLPYYLVKAGYSVLSVDMRGHGKSIRTSRGKRLTWRALKDNDWLTLPRDVDRMVHFFQENKEDYPQINSSHAALIGAQLGASVAMSAAVDINAYAKNTVGAVVLIDANREFRSIKLSEKIISYTLPLFVAASQTNPQTFSDSQLLYRWALGPKVLRLYKNVGDGTMLVRNQPDLQVAIAQWLKRYYKLPSAAPLKVAPAKPKK
jgi:pimeloyl-ACP methyl ester carboxylesterase